MSDPLLPSVPSLASSSPPPPDHDQAIIAVYLHGFKGGDHTFSSFPDRISSVLSASYPRTHFESIVAPAYDTRGFLGDAVDHHAEWLVKLIMEKQADYRATGGKGTMSVVLLGHSMGGLVIADLMLAFKSTPWPPILGLIAFDTPYFGLNPTIFKNTAEKYLGYANEAQAGLTALGVGWGLLNSFRSTSAPASAPTESHAASSKSTSEADIVHSSSTSARASTAPPASSSWLSPLATGALAITAAAAVGGATYFHRDTIGTQFSWASSHLSFVGELWKTTALEKRMLQIEDSMQNDGLGFRCFYTLLPSPSPTASPPRTFIVLPPLTSPIAKFFQPNLNSKASDSIAAHVDMFESKSDGVYELGSETVKVISEWIDRAERAKMGKGGSGGEKESLI